MREEMNQYDKDVDLDFDNESEDDRNYMAEVDDDFEDAKPHVPTEAELAYREAEIMRLFSRYPLTLTQEQCLAMRNDPNRHSEWYSHLLASSGEGRKVGTYLQSKEQPNPWDIAEGKATCNICGGHGSATYLMYAPRTNFYWKNTEDCVCRKYKFAHRLLKAKLPPVLHDFRLSTLKPYLSSSLTATRQNEEIQFIKDNIQRGFMWYGKPGTSKSTMSACLLRAAINYNIDPLYKWGSMCDDAKLRSLIGIWNIDGNRLLESEVEYATSDDKKNCHRLVTVADIEKAKDRGIRPFLLIEELDKRRMTEFAANVLFKLVDAIDRMEGQLVITTNLTPQQFGEMFSKSNDANVQATGEALLRRIKKLCEQRNLFQ